MDPTPLRPGMRVLQRYDTVRDAREGVRALEDAGLDEEQIHLVSEEAYAGAAEKSVGARDDRILRHYTRATVWGGLLGTILGAVVGLVLAPLWATTALSVLGTVVVAGFIGGSIGIVLVPVMGSAQTNTGDTAVEIAEVGPVGLAVDEDEKVVAVAEQALQGTPAPERRGPK